jgi:predicted NBD/HSP70 family sugar kinase
MHQTGDASLIRRINQSAVIDLLREEGSLTRAEIARRLQLSAPTITRIVAALIESGHVVERYDDGGGMPVHNRPFADAPPDAPKRPPAADKAGGRTRGENAPYAAGSAGRRALLVQYNARSSLIIGVYIGGETIGGALTDLNGNILRRKSLPSQVADAGVRQVVSLIRHLCGEATRLGLTVRGVGVGAPSVVTHPNGVVLLSPMHQWRNLPLKALLEAEVGLPVFVENKVNLMTLGEAWRGAGQGIDPLVCMTVGAGIGAGLLINGRLHRGAHQAAGEVGYILPNEHLVGSRFDHYGALEGLAGHAGIVERARLLLEAGRPSSLSPDSLSIGAVLAATRAGDPLALDVHEKTLTWLTMVVADIASVLDPERVILVPELPEYGDLYLEPIRKRLEGLVPAPPELVLSELAQDAPIYGAVAAALRETSGSLSVQRTRA